MLKVKVGNMISRNGNEVPNQFEIVTDEGIYFQSYTTVIACKSFIAPVVYLDPKWDYSRTTMKYLNQFLGTSSKKEIEAGIKSGRFIIEELN